MIELVTKAEAYEHLRLDYDSDGSADDGWLDVFIPAISEAVMLWLKVPARAYEPELDTDGLPVVDTNGDPVPLIDSDGNEVVRWCVKAAVLIELASTYRYREGEGKDNVMPSDAGYGYVLNKVSTNLLTPLRKPLVA